METPLLPARAPPGGSPARLVAADRRLAVAGRLAARLGLGAAFRADLAAWLLAAAGVDELVGFLESRGQNDSPWLRAAVAAALAAP